jgi:hypothetical protein
MDLGDALAAVGKADPLDYGGYGLAERETRAALAPDVKVRVVSGQHEGMTGVLAQVHKSDTLGVQTVSYGVKFKGVTSLVWFSRNRLEPLPPAEVKEKDSGPRFAVGQPVRIREGTWRGSCGPVVEVLLDSGDQPAYAVNCVRDGTLVFFQDQLELVRGIPGVGPDAPTETNENGASQSQTRFACTSLPPRALLAVAAVQQHGDDKYGVDNWRGISVQDHLNHALIHYLAYQAGDTQDKHLEHFATRALMALEIELEGKL